MLSIYLCNCLLTNILRNYYLVMIILTLIQVIKMARAVLNCFYHYKSLIRLNLVYYIPGYFILTLANKLYLLLHSIVRLYSRIPI